MVVCFNCTPEGKAKLDRLLQKGGYQDYAGAISAAIENLLVIEEHVAKSGTVILGDAARPGPGSSIQPPVSPQPTTTRAALESPGYVGVFAPFGRVSFTSTPSLAAAPSTETDGIIGPDRWIFGQYNKLLPLKANCRLIACMLHTEPSGVSLQAVIDAIQQYMPGLRQWLSDYDSKYGLERESALATAFPTKDTKSLLRYTNQFVISVNKKGALTGLPAALGLLNALDAKGTRVSLTEAGLRFALLPNPVLDPPRNPEQRLSDQEQLFLLDHVRAAVPREHGSYINVLQAIQEGASSPETLDDALRPLVTAGGSISDPYLSTQRSGVISRMTELGLVVRRREGIRVVYSLTQEGQRYINAEKTAAR